VLPQHGDKDEDGRDEDEGKSDLRHRSRREGLDVDIGACGLVCLLVPPRKGRKQDECEEGEDDGDDEEVRENDGVLEGCCDPHKVERVLINRQIVDEGGCVVGTNVATAIAVDADAKVANAYTELGVTDNVCDGLCDARIDLFGGVCRCVLFVPQRDEEDAGDEWRRGGASCQ
jgi:hypothetical protein